MTQLFACTAVGVCLGASQVGLAILIVSFNAALLSASKRLSRTSSSKEMVLRLEGETGGFFPPQGPSAWDVVCESSEEAILFRLEKTQETVSLQALVVLSRSVEVTGWIAALRRKLPNVDLSGIEKSST